jgi:hypothetical protein
MASLLVDVEIEGDAIALQGRSELEGVPDGYRLILPGVPDEGGRGSRRHLLLIRQQPDVLGRRVIPEQVLPRSRMPKGLHGDHRIAEDAEVGTGAEPIHRVGRLGIPGVEMGE